MKIRLLSSLIVAVMCTALAAPAYAYCTWSVVDTTIVTTLGNLYDSNGNVIGQVPLYTTVTLYWEAECHWDDPIYIPPPNNHPAPYETEILVQNVRVNTVDPENPTITADVSSSHTAYPPAEVLLLIDGYAQTSIYPSANGTYSFDLPAIRTFGDGATEFAIEACDSEDRCATGNAQMVKNTPSAVEAADTLHVWRYEGDDLLRAVYGHTFRQVYAKTVFNVPEEGENSRYQLKENGAVLSWNDPTPNAIFSAGAYADMTNGQTISLGWCSWGEPACYTDHCAAQCGYFGSYGLYAPAVDEWISSIRTENFEPWGFSYGGMLRVQIP
jgi:hypothetical protein